MAEELCSAGNTFLGFVVGLEVDAQIGGGSVRVDVVVQRGLVDGWGDEQHIWEQCKRCLEEKWIFSPCIPDCSSQESTYSSRGLFTTGSKALGDGSSPLSLVSGRSLRNQYETGEQLEKTNSFPKPAMRTARNSFFWNAGSTVFRSMVVANKIRLISRRLSHLQFLK